MSTATEVSVATPAPRVIDDETANQITHGAGLVLSIFGAVALALHVRAQGDAWRTLGCDLYAASLVGVYAASTLSHSFRYGRWREFFRMLDQALIFLLIAGTQAPFGLTYFRDGWVWTLYLVVCGVAVFGAVFKLLARRATNVHLALYLLAGWLPIVGAHEVVARLPFGALAWIVAGGMFYTVGTYFLEFDKKTPYAHAIWHLFVIAASACHYIAIWHYVAGG